MFAAMFVLPLSLELWRRRVIPGWAHIAVYVALETCILVLPARYLWAVRLPIASGFIVACESTRLAMKAHSFIRETWKLATIPPKGEQRTAAPPPRTPN
jgi:hypothetical protein